MDQEFEKLKEKIGLIEINTTAARKHVGEIERSNRMIQERSRAICSLLPYSILPKQVVIHMVYFVVTFLNCEAIKLGILDIFLPRELVLRQKLNWIKHFTNRGKALKFGEHIEAHKDPNITNTSQYYTYPSI